MAVSKAPREEAEVKNPEVALGSEATYNASTGSTSFSTITLPLAKPLKRAWDATKKTIGGTFVHVFSPPKEEMKPVRMGETLFYLERIWGRQDSRKRMLFVRLHCDEITAHDVTRRYVMENGGEFLSIEPHPLLNMSPKGEMVRAVNFEHIWRGEKNKYYFDANRIFTHEGVEKTVSTTRKRKDGEKDVQDWRPGEKEAIVKIVTAFRMKLIDEMHPAARDILVSVHNNRTYTVDAAVKDIGKTGLVHKNPEKDPHNFYWVTDREDFEAFKGMGFNVVMQGRDVPEDGSLSVFCGKRLVDGKPMRYINIECAHDAGAEQRRMLEVLKRLRVSRR